MHVMVPRAAIPLFDKVDQDSVFRVDVLDS